MKDRTPKYPGRVKLVPVAGQTNVYDMTRVDQPTQVGDPMNKATFLKDATAALYGLGASAVPDEVLAFLGTYNQYRWRRRKVDIVYDLKVTDNTISDITTPYYMAKVSGTASTGYDRPFTIKYSDSVVVNKTGQIMGLSEPISTIQASYDNYKPLEQLVGKFFTQVTVTSDGTQTDGSIYKFMTSEELNPVGRDVNVSETQFVVFAKHTGVLSTVARKVYGDWDTVISSDRNAYPDSGESGGYEYQYLGKPFDNAVTVPKMAFGSYVGTGTHGDDNPNMLTFPFAPKLVIVTHADAHPTIFQYPVTSVLTWEDQNSGGDTTAEWSGNTLSWRGGGNYWYGGGGSSTDMNEKGQLNVLGKTYFYFAIGVGGEA